MFTKENFIKLNFKKKILISSLSIFLISMILLTGFTFKMVSNKFQNQVQRRWFKSSKASKFSNYLITKSYKGNRQNFSR